MNTNYIKEMFEPTLLYSFSLAVLGISAAYLYGYFSPVYSVLLVAGALLAQISVNVISDYFDYRSGLDRELTRRKSSSMSGGSSLLAEGKIRPGPTLALGTTSFAIAAVIGIYFLLARPYILPILLIAAFSIVLYARYVKRIPYLSEMLCTFNYILIPAGCFIVIAGVTQLTPALAFAFVPAGIMLGGTALFINSIPDMGIDKKYGAMHTAIMLRTNNNIGAYYLGVQLFAFTLLTLGIGKRMLPISALLCFAVMPVTFYIFSGLYWGNKKRYRAYLTSHTLASFALTMILAATYIVAVA